jgi:hypothetical protein
MPTNPRVLAALVWVPFLSIFVFASLGDTSALHISSHLLALACLVPGVVIARRLRHAATRGLRRILTTVLTVVVPLAVLGHLAELGVAVARLASDGWVNLDTADIWVSGPHVWAANVTVPAMLVAMIVTLVLVVADVVARRRSPEPA